MTHVLYGCEAVKLCCSMPAARTVVSFVYQPARADSQEYTMHYIDRLLDKIPVGIREPLLNILGLACVVVAFTLICKLAFGD
jgi:hypothetical protein